MTAHIFLSSDGRLKVTREQIPVIKVGESPDYYRFQTTEYITAIAAIKERAIEVGNPDSDESRPMIRKATKDESMFTDQFYPIECEIEMRDVIDEEISRRRFSVKKLAYLSPVKVEHSYSRPDAEGNQIGTVVGITDPIDTFKERLIAEVEKAPDYTTFGAAPAFRKQQVIELIKQTK